MVIEGKADNHTTVALRVPIQTPHFDHLTSSAIDVASPLEGIGSQAFLPHLATDKRGTFVQP